jgi:hypothetical protein
VGVVVGRVEKEVVVVVTVVKLLFKLLSVVGIVTGVTVPSHEAIVIQ